MLCGRTMYLGRCALSGLLLLTGCTEVTVNLQDSCVNVYLEAELTVDDVEKMPLPERVDPSVGVEPVARPAVVLEL